MKLSIKFFDHIKSKNHLETANLPLEELILDKLPKTLSRSKYSNYVEVVLNDSCIAKFRKTKLTNQEYSWILLEK